MADHEDPEIELRELGAGPSDRTSLAAFYGGVYVHAFPDPDERESLANMAAYLERKAAGWYGNNNYHIVLAERRHDIVGGFVIDYFEKPNAGVIEFLFTVPGARQGGVGSRLLAFAERLLQEDATRAGKKALGWIAAEMNDPFALPETPDNLDPFTRARIWSKWGFGALDFPYVQPPLAADRQAVPGLLLIAKPMSTAMGNGVESALVDSFVQEYLRWAMRIEDPASNVEYRAMALWLSAHPVVAWNALSRYIGEDSRPRFAVLDLADATEAELAATVAVYRQCFANRATALDAAEFRRGLDRYREAGYCYHLWALREEPSGVIAGVASFFSFEAIGFGGYVALTGPLRDKGCLRPLLARIEQQMRRDPGNIRGWLIETESVRTQRIFSRLGFRALSLTFSQPPLPPSRGTEAAATLCLMYKPLGRVYGASSLSPEELLAGIAFILRHVYRIDDPFAHPSYHEVARQIQHGVRFVDAEPPSA